MTGLVTTVEDLLGLYLMLRLLIHKHRLSLFTSAMLKDKRKRERIFLNRLFGCTTYIHYY